MKLKKDSLNDKMTLEFFSSIYENYLNNYNHMRQRLDHIISDPYLEKKLLK